MTDAPDVLFVVLDSARTDRLSPYGHDRETTPALADLAEGATLYENAYTPAPWTLPSHCSMFTGLFPSEHGVTNGFADASPRLPGEISTLPEALGERGYRTAGFSNNPWVGSLSGLDRGFDEFVEWDLEIGARGDAGIHGARDELYSRAHGLLGQAARTPLYLLKRRFFTGNLVERAGRWLAAAPSPSFTFLNLMEAHSPYYPPRSAFRELGLARPGPLEARRLNLRLTAYLLGKTDVDAQRDRLLDYYDASLRYQDGKLAELLAATRERGRFEDALVVVCADHGKTLGDHDRDGEPPHYLREVNTNVPLVVKWPGQTEGERVAEPVELRGLFDAILGGGRRDALPGEDGALVEDHVPHTGSEREAVTRWRALADGEHTFVRSERGAEFLLATGGRDELLDVAGRDLGPFRARLDDREARLSGEPAGDESGGELQGTVRSQLEDLGYM